MKLALELGLEQDRSHLFPTTFASIDLHMGWCRAKVRSMHNIHGGEELAHYGWLLEAGKVCKRQPRH